jgi:hypothetical protein
MSEPPNPAPPPATIAPCPDCGGQRVGGVVARAPGDRWDTGGFHVSLGYWDTTGGKPLTRLHALACLQCGLVKLYTQDLEAVRRATAAHPERFWW